MPIPSDAAKRLASLVNNDKSLPGRIRDVLGVSLQLVAFWRSGERRPGAHFRDALEAMLGIPRDAWLTADERAVVRRARKAA